MKKIVLSVAAALINALKVLLNPRLGDYHHPGSYSFLYYSPIKNKNMKKLFAGLLAITILVIAACNNNKQNNLQNHNKMNHDSMSQDKMQMDSMKDMKHDSMSSMNHSKEDASMTGMSGEMTVTKTNIGDADPAVKKFINTITAQYLFIKNGLAGDNTTEAKTGATQLNSTIKKFDKSLFTARQKREFDKHADDTKDQLQAIVSGNTIVAQRTSFSMLSQHIYELIKIFGPGRMMYRDYCPMAFDNKGAIWLSETREIKNPYFGSNMLNCGTVQEIIQ